MGNCSQDLRLFQKVEIGIYLFLSLNYWLSTLVGFVKITSLPFRDQMNKPHWIENTESVMRPAVCGKESHRYHPAQPPPASPVSPDFRLPICKRTVFTPVDLSGLVCKPHRKL